MTRAGHSLPALAAALGLACAGAGAAAGPETLAHAGWLERARLTPGEVVLEAKLDTGAMTSSLDAVEVRQFERDGRRWVAFTVVGTDGRRVRLERPLVRLARIRSALGVDEARPTVTLGICIGPVYRVTEVNLARRAHLDVPLLIGRRFLEGRFVVDSGRRHLHEPDCEPAPPP